MARAIDADAVCERCRKSGSICTGNDCEIPTMPTLTPPNEWVSVEERLPEDDLPEGTNRLQIKVLVAIKAKNGYTVRTQNRIRQNQSWSNKEPFTAWYWKYSLGEVTHWMPLPQPPKEDE